MVPSVTKLDPHPLAGAAMVRRQASMEIGAETGVGEVFPRGTGRRGLGWESGTTPWSRQGAGSERGTMPRTALGGG